MKHHQQTLLESLSDCNHGGRALFALLGAERLRSCCEVWQNTQGLPLTPYFDGLEEGFAALQTKNTLPPETGERVVERLTSCVPHAGDPLAVQVQSGVVCLLEAFHLLSGSEVESDIEAANAVIDAVDHYVFFNRVRQSGGTSGQDDSVLLQQELERQLADVRTASTFDQLSTSDLKALRRENLQFAVPAAVC